MPRSKLDVLAEVLEAARDGATKTKIVSQVNLNQTLATHVLHLLGDLSLVTTTHNSPTLYGTTEKGLQFLQQYQRLQMLLLSELSL